MELNQELFTKATLKQRFPFVTTFLKGLIIPQELTMELGKIYLIDTMENREFFVYDRELCGRAKKILWKMPFAYVEAAECVPKVIDTVVVLNGIPSFDPEFGPNGGSWIKLDYSVRIQLGISVQTVGRVRESTNPLLTVSGILRKIALEILPHLPYQQALLGKTGEDICGWVRNFTNPGEKIPALTKLGFEALHVSIEVVEGSKKLDNVFAKQFEDLALAKNVVNKAQIWNQLDLDMADNYIALNGGAGAGEILKARHRLSDSMAEALLAAGHDPISVFKEVSAPISLANQNRGQANPLNLEVASQLFDKIERKDWPNLQIPNPTSTPHPQRLAWESDILSERIPMWYQGLAGSQFTIKFDNGKICKIDWGDPGYPPQVWIDNEDVSDEIASLRYWNYDQITAWDLFTDAERIADLD